MLPYGIANILQSSVITFGYPAGVALLFNTFIVTSSIMHHLDASCTARVSSCIYHPDSYHFTTSAVSRMCIFSSQYRRMIRTFSVCGMQREALATGCTGGMNEQYRSGRITAFRIPAADQTTLSAERIRLRERTRRAAMDSGIF